MKIIPSELQHYLYNEQGQELTGGYPLSKSIENSQEKMKTEFTVLGDKRIDNKRIDDKSLGGMNSMVYSQFKNKIVPSGVVKTQFHSSNRRKYEIIDGGFLEEEEYNKLLGLVGGSNMRESNTESLSKKKTKNNKNHSNTRKPRKTIKKR